MMHDNVDRIGGLRFPSFRCTVRHALAALFHAMWKMLPGAVTRVNTVAQAEVLHPTA